MIAIGIGCRKACPAEEIIALVREGLTRLPPEARAGGLFTLATKRDEPGLRDAAATLGLPLVFFEAEALRRVAGDAETVSPRIEALLGLPSVAETAALAGAGAGAALLVARLSTPRATCAIAGPRP